MYGFPVASAFTSAYDSAASSTSSQERTGDLLVIICPINFCLFSISCHEYESNVFSVTYLNIFTRSFLLPWRSILPSCCSMSDGLHGTSMWWSAMSLVCTLVPAPIFAVEPNRKRTWPLLTFENSSAFCFFVLASCIKAISLSGTPLAISLSLMAWYTSKPPSLRGVEASQKISCVDLSSAVSFHMSYALAAHAFTFEFSLSGRSGFMSRWSMAHLRPSLVTLSILSMLESTPPFLMFSALSPSDLTISC